MRSTATCERGNITPLIRLRASVVLLILPADSEQGSARKEHYSMPYPKADSTKNGKLHDVRKPDKQRTIPWATVGTYYSSSDQYCEMHIGLDDTMVDVL